MAKEKQKRGQSRKTPEECRAAFDEFVEALGAQNLSLEVDENSRCSVAVTHESGGHTTIVKPVAGNTFVKGLKMAQLLAPHVNAA